MRALLSLLLVGSLMGDHKMDMPKMDMSEPYGLSLEAGLVYERLHLPVGCYGLVLDVLTAGTKMSGSSDNETVFAHVELPQNEAIPLYNQIDAVLGVWASFSKLLPKSDGIMLSGSFSWVESGKSVVSDTPIGDGNASSDMSRAYLQARPFYRGICKSSDTKMETDRRSFKYYREDILYFGNVKNRLNVNQFFLDISFGRVGSLSETFAIIPEVGLVGLFNYYENDTFYDYGENKGKRAKCGPSDDSPEELVAETRMAETNDTPYYLKQRGEFWGLGGSLGLGLRYCLSPLSITLDNTFSLLVGEHSIYELLDVMTNDDIPIIDNDKVIDVAPSPISSFAPFMRMALAIEGGSGSFYGKVAFTTSHCWGQFYRLNTTYLNDGDVGTVNEDNFFEDDMGNGDDVSRCAKLYTGQNFSITPTTTTLSSVGLIFSIGVCL